VNPLILVHVIAGTLALTAGGAALLFRKGSVNHRRAGIAFGLIMLAMAISGATAAIAYGAAPRLNTLVSLTTVYLVATGWATVRAKPTGVSALDRALCMFGFGVAAVGAILVALSIIRGPPASAGIYAAFAGIALRGALLDRTMIRAGGIKPTRRLPRHLWRMCVAFAIAAFAFFLGQQDEFPEAIRGPHWALPPVAVLATMGWWMFRMRPRNKAVA
jgi:hypothetical protein